MMKLSQSNVATAGLVSPLCLYRSSNRPARDLTRIHHLSPLRTSLVCPKVFHNGVENVLSLKFRPASKVIARSICVGQQASIETREWIWEGYKIRYQVSGESGPPILCVHGFGANCDHWRKNLPVLGMENRVFAIDLLGYGYSDKPDPTAFPPNTIYTFETWARQASAFIDEVIGEPTFIACNSVGGNVGLLTSLTSPDKVLGLFLLNISLRQLHIKKQPWYAKPFVKALQTTLRTTDIGKWFFKSVASEKSVKQILQQCYHDDSQVTDELVRFILEPGLKPGAVSVFLDFICYSGGPLPEEMLPDVQCPVVIGWGVEDPWESVVLGREYGRISTVNQFIELEGVGHCPQDEAPHLVNPLIAEFVQTYSN